MSGRRATRAISILQVHIQELKYGREGPDYFAVDRAPYTGKQDIVEATLFGQEGIASVRFELIDGLGGRIATVPALRIGDGADADQYLLEVDVPRQPFRFRIQGEDAQGRPFTNIFSRLFVAVEGSVPPVQIPNGLNAEQARLLQGLIDSTSQETRLRFATAAREHPDGLIRIPRSRVVAASYEPFVSALGNTLGIHLNLEVRFGQAGFYNLTPNVFPLYGNSQWRGAISMKVLDAQVSPMPPAVADSPVDGIADVLRYGGAAHYEGNVEYQVTFDLVPNYVIRNADGNRYCLYTEGVRSGSRAAVWDAIQQSADAVKYRIDVASLDFAGEASALPPERTYFDGFLREGARDCGPTPNIHF